MNFELDIIIQMGFPGYFLIVMDFIQWAKSNGVPVGPGRGSGAGSLVAYVQKITDLDPLEYDLLFERFLNPERVSMPDFDVDFCMDGRDRVIDYVAEKYGRNAVSQIITFGSMAAKAVVRDVARVQGKSYGLADRLSKMIPFEVGMTLEKAYEQEEILRDFIKVDEEAAEIWEMARKLEGVVRNVGKHAGGVVIAPTKLTDFSPIYCDEAGDGLVTQFDKDDVEAAGLVKFDFLGLRTLTVIDWALKTINRDRAKVNEPPLDIAFIPLDDKPTYTLLQKAETTAVFQLESRGMKELIKKLKPDCLEDLIALVALFRPGPLQSGMVDDFINRKHGRAELAYPHSDYQYEGLKPVLAPTYGIILYQEQVMQIAQVMAGYTLGGADMLRRAMGKKKPEEMAKQRGGFIEGCATNNIDADLAGNIFDLVEKFAGYGFNKSHSAAYGLVSYQTAWLKTHYPAPFMAAVLSADMHNTDKVVTLIEEIRTMKLRLDAPDVNTSEFKFTVNDEGRIIYGLGAIKGVGEGPVEAITEARQDGPFKDLFDFCARVDLKRINKRTLDGLIRSGALDRLGPYFHDEPKAYQANIDQQPRGLAERDGRGDQGCRANRAYPRQRPRRPVWRAVRRGRRRRLRQSSQGQGTDPQGTPERRERHPGPVPDRSPDRRIRRRDPPFRPSAHHRLETGAGYPDRRGHDHRPAGDEEQKGRQDGFHHPRRPLWPDRSLAVRRCVPFRAVAVADRRDGGGRRRSQQRRLLRWPAPAGQAGDEHGRCAHQPGRKPAPEAADQGSEGRSATLAG